ncbi:ExeM/NucH family extracellular endonuclease [Crystallibacter degradans]|uniref:ExeM/NucH family extracellular endonuclease n=1 Tax=Crystallibacter degradans TaxID=2726743 RepID=UPI00197B21A2|nr:ExeM/NucH family extracellular endonuclease [Arthrobacter sp. SF27]
MKATLGAAMSIGLLAAPFAALPAVANETDPEPTTASSPAEPAEAALETPAEDQQIEPQAAGDTYELNLLGINDFHGRIDENTVKFAGTVEELRAQNPDGTLFTSAGDNIGASLFASASQDDQPTIDVLNALELATTAVGNHEFDKGFADLNGRVSTNSSYPQLGANVYSKGTTTPALQEYALVEVAGLTVGVIGVVTQETSTLVSPGGISTLDFGDPVAAVNRVAAELTDGTGDEADIILASFHEGAATGASLDAALDSAVFARIADETSAEVDAIFTGHTHQVYTFDAPVPGTTGETRPIVQTGQYGENVGQIQLSVTEGEENGEATFDVTSYEMALEPRKAIPDDDAANADELNKALDDELANTYPRVAEVRTIVVAALAEAEVVGARPVGSVTGDITTAFTPDGEDEDTLPERDDRASESTLGNLVADSLMETLSAEGLGGAEIGVVNPGGLRSELYYAPDGTITSAEANAVLPFVNNLWTTTLTGAQFKTLLEQQWQLDADGNVPSRPFLHLGLSDNVNYTYDPNAEQGSHVTGVWINGEQLDETREYRIGTFSFLAQGGDNFHVFTEGTDTRDSGLIDRDAWIAYLEQNSPLSPSFDRRAVALTGVPATVEPGQQVSFGVSKLDLTSLGAPVNTELTLRYEPADSGASAFTRSVPAAALPATLGTFDVADGAATVSFTVPDELSGGVFTLTAAESGTLVRLPIEIPVAELPADIAEIQGTSDVSPLAGKDVTTRGVVTAVYPEGGFNGYYIQTPGTGGDIAEDHAASHGIFVFSPSTVDEVALGDHVEVTGGVSAYHGLTELTVDEGGLVLLDEPAEEVKPATIEWPASNAEREKFEGMLLDPQGGFTVTDNYSLNQYGEIGLAAGDEPLVQPAAVGTYGSDEFWAETEKNAALSVTLDDGASINYLGSDANKDIPLPYLTPETPVRVGSAASFDTSVVLDYRFGLWRFQPLTQLTAANSGTVQPASFPNTRAQAPEEVGGNVKIASFNVLNYFTTTGDQLDGCKAYTDRDGNPVTARNCDARGAYDAENLERQEAKIVAAINALDTDVVALEEIENSAQFGKDRDDALAALTAALNEGLAAGEDAAAAAWDYVRSPEELPELSDEDFIRTAFIYKKDAVQTIGESVIHNDTDAFANARRPLAQTFKVKHGGADTKFIVVANHFKSKGSAPSSGENADHGQGAWNAARTEQAKSLVGFAGTMQEKFSTDKVYLTGDFNSYAQEDPIRILAEAGYINQGAKTGEHSYNFDGMVGSLDYIFASPEADAVVEGADIWNINSVESIALEYSRYSYNVTDFYAPDMFRASDHDPIVVGLDLPTARDKAHGRR